MRKHTLQRSIFIGFTIYAAVMVICIGTVVVLQHLETKRTESHTDAFAFTKSAAAYIDGDILESYGGTSEPNEYYNEIRRYFTANVMNSNLLDFYLGIPTEEGIIFLLDIPKNGDYYQMGELVPYSDFGDGAKEYVYSLLSADPPEEIVAGYDNEVYIATACSPVYNSKGEPVAIVAVDLLMPNVKTEIQSALLRVIFAIITLVLLSALTFFAFERKLVIV